VKKVLAYREKNFTQPTLDELEKLLKRIEKM
jgi:hypothetical protein